MAVAQLQDSGTNMTHKIGQWGETDNMITKHRQDRLDMNGALPL